MPKIGPWLLAFAPLVCVMILFSHGLSFARWNAYQGLPQQWSGHAILITLGGIGLLFAGILLSRLSESERDLRQRLAELEMRERG